MNIGQFLIIFWARRVLIFAATASSLIGALIVTAILPAQWKATERIMLNYVKPDPVTGQVIAGPSARAYVSTQIELITDYSVAGKVAEQVGWLTDPLLASQYNQRPKDDKRDFRHWTADLVIQNTKVKLLQDSNILEITYTANTPDGAIAVTDALRKAYMDTSLEFRREDAERNAVWYVAQSTKARQALDQAVAAEAAYERENGLVMQGRTDTDAESARLQALSTEAAPLGLPPLPSVESSPANTELADVEARLAAALKILGPNNPEVLVLESKRSSLQALVARDRVASRAAEARAASGGARALEREVEAQKTKVIAQSEKIGRLDQLHQDVLRARDEYNRVEAKVSQYHQESLSDDVGMTLLGNATTPKSPTFPNFLLIIPGAIVLGMGVGLFVGLLMELLARRVRTQDDLHLDGDEPVICLVPAPEVKKTPPSVGTGRRFAWMGNRGAVGA